MAQPDYFQYLGAALFMFGGAWALIKWVGRTIRDELGPGANRADAPFLPMHVDNVPPALVKDAIARGLVTSVQLAGMKPMEREFVFASLRERLAAPAAAATGATGATAPPSPPAPARHAIDGAEFGMASMPANDTLRVHCPICGDPLDLPAFVPFVGHCKRCGAKTVVREEEGGRYVLSVTPRQQS
jgi:hypothetical protein